MIMILPDNFSTDRYGLTVRFVNEDDADFIVKLRTDPKLGMFINKTTPDVEAQRAWIRGYKERQKAGTDYYFMFEKPAGTRLGVCRIYDIHENDFTIGSWIFSPEAPVGTSILADIITREIAYELFPESKHLFDVKKDNINVNRYNETFKSELMYTDELTNFYSCSRENFEKYKKLHIRMFASR